MIETNDIVYDYLVENLPQYRCIKTMIGIIVSKVGGEAISLYVGLDGTYYNVGPSLNLFETIKNFKMKINQDLYLSDPQFFEKLKKAIINRFDNA